MALTNPYTSLVLLKAYLGISVSTLDTQIESAINAASRSIDTYCQRRFWLDSSVVARTFVPQGLSFIDLRADIGATAGVVVKVDTGGDGTFETTWASTDYQLYPADAATRYPEARPWTGLRAVGTKTFPWMFNTWLTRLDRVEITAKWGWPTVPDAVAQATLIKAARLFHRKDSPQGVAGFGDFGPVRISRFEDPDVVSLLEGYRRQGVLVA
jgi:hypothetical protein